MEQDVLLISVDWQWCRCYAEQTIITVSSFTVTCMMSFVISIQFILLNMLRIDYTKRSIVAGYYTTIISWYSWTNNTTTPEFVSPQVGVLHHHEPICVCCYVFLSTLVHPSPIQSWPNEVHACLHVCNSLWNQVCAIFTTAYTKQLTTCSSQDL